MISENIIFTRLLSYTFTLKSDKPNRIINRFFLSV